jgi:2'-5' RNA ligase
MTDPATVEAHERLRLFVGIPVPAADAPELLGWLDGLDLRGARPVRPADLHLTLAFLGHRPRADLDAVVRVVEELRGRPRPLLRVERYRETRSVGMLVLADEGGRAAAIAEHAQRRLEEEGLYRREGRPWLPHVTVLRFRERPRLRPPPATLTNVRSIAPSDAAAYLSILRPTGAQYEIVQQAAFSPQQFSPQQFSPQQ